MNFRLVTRLSASALLAALAISAQVAGKSSTYYTVTDLGPPGNPSSVANFVNKEGLVVGADTVLEGATARSHAVLWYKNLFVDLKQIVDKRQPGLLGPNSAAGAVNDSDQIVIGGETLHSDPNNENFCGFGTGLQCVVFVWKDDVLKELPNPLGGTNSSFGGINNRGEVAGFAENTTEDPECLAAAPNGTGPQILDYEAVIWGPGPDRFRQLHPLPGDSVGIALGINDRGQVVGISGRCGNTVIPPGTAGPHAVLWDADGSVHDLGSFGGTSNPAILGVGNAALAINNRGQVVGTSAPPGNLVNQPFLWTRKKGMQHLQLLSGDVVGAGLGINNRGEVVGASISPGGLASGNPSAVLWRNGAEGGVTDLNSFLTAKSPFVALLTAFGINDGGEIVGFGRTSAGDVHAFLATPTHCEPGEIAEPAVQPVPRPLVLPENARALISGHFAIRR